MSDEIKVQVFRNGELVKEVNDPNVVVISEWTRGVFLSGADEVKAAIIAAQVSLVYDDIVEVLKATSGLTGVEVRSIINSIKSDIVATLAEQGEGE